MTHWKCPECGLVWEAFPGGDPRAWSCGRCTDGYGRHLTALVEATQKEADAHAARGRDSAKGGADAHAD